MATSPLARLHVTLFPVAILMGAAIAWLDTRPSWDDTGVTAGLLFVSATILGALAPTRPWLWALAIGLWIPAMAIVKAPSWSSAAMVIVLAIPFVGAYFGTLVGRLLRRA